MLFAQHLYSNSTLRHLFAEVVIGKVFENKQNLKNEENHNIC